MYMRPVLWHTSLYATSHNASNRIYRRAVELFQHVNVEKGKRQGPYRSQSTQMIGQGFPLAKKSRDEPLRRFGVGIVWHRVS